MLRTKKESPERHLPRDAPEEALNERNLLSKLVKSKVLWSEEHVVDQTELDKCPKAHLLMAKIVTKDDSMEDKCPNLIPRAGSPVIVCAPVTTNLRHREGVEPADWLYYAHQVTYSTREGYRIQKVITTPFRYIRDTVDGDMAAGCAASAPACHARTASHQHGQHQDYGSCCDFGLRHVDGREPDGWLPYAPSGTTTEQHRVSGRLCACWS